VDTRPNRKKKAVFSDSSGLVHGGQDQTRMISICKSYVELREVFLSFRPPWPFNGHFLHPRQICAFWKKIALVY